MGEPVTSESERSRSEDAVATIGVHLLGTEDAATEDELNDRAREMLSRALNTRRVIGFVGSGVSRAYDFPSWEDLTADIVKITKNELKGRKPQNLLDLLDEEPDGLMSHVDHMVLRLAICEKIAEHMGQQDEFRAKISKKI